MCSSGGVQQRRCAAAAVCSSGGVQQRRCAAAAVCSGVCASTLGCLSNFFSEHNNKSLLLPESVQKIKCYNFE
jgi:hypothetical protein